MDIYLQHFQLARQGKFAETAVETEASVVDEHIYSHTCPARLFKNVPWRFGN